EQKRIAVAQEEKARKEEAKAKIARDEAEYEGYIAKIGLAAAKIDQNSFLYADELLESCRPTLRHWEWGRIKYLLRRDDGSFPHRGPVEAAVYSPDAKTIFTASLDGRAVQWDAGSKKQVNQFPHGGPIWSLALTADGSRLATGGADGRIKLWNVADGSLFGEIAAHTQEVLALAFTKQGNKLASGSRDRHAMIWDVATQQPIMGLGGLGYGHGRDVWSVAWSPNDEKALVTAGEDGKVIVWRVDRPMFKEDLPSIQLEPGSRLRNLPRGKKVAEYVGHGGPVSNAIFTPDAKHIISAGFDKDIHVWFAEIDRTPTALVPSVRFGAFVKKLSGHLNRVWALSISPDAKRLVSGADDNTVRVWELGWGTQKSEINPGVVPEFPVCKEGRLVETFRGHSARVRSVNQSPLDTRPLSASDDGMAKLWRSGAFRDHDTFATNQVVLTSAPSRDGQRVLVGGDDRVVRLLKIDDHSELATLDEGNRDAVTAIDVTADGRRFLGADATGLVFVWDSATRAELLSVQAHAGKPDDFQPCAAAFSPDGRWIVTGGADKAVRVFDSHTGALVQESKQHGAPVSAVAFSPDQKHFLSGDRAGAVLVHEFGKPGTAPSYTEHGPTLPITGIAFFKDGTVATSSLDRSISIWDLTTRKERFVLAPPKTEEGDCGIHSLAISPDEKYILTGCGDGVARLWDVSTRKLAKSLKGHDETVLSVAFAPAAGRALTASLDGTLIRWDLESGKFERTPRNSYRPTSLVRFSSDGKNLLTADQDAVSWRTAAGDLVFDVVRHALLENVAFSADESQAITAGSDAAVKIWDLRSTPPRVMGRL
ncbi:MAG TPA: WD40 repeat domain-containing protein, partial [Pirellulales bacterium]